MHFSTLFTTSAMLIGLASAAPLETRAESTAKFHITNFSGGYNPDTQKMDLAFDIKGTSANADERFPKTHCAAHQKGATSGYIHKIKQTSCGDNDEIGFSLEKHGEGWKLVIEHFLPHDQPFATYDSASHVFPKTQTLIVHEGDVWYQVFSEPEGGAKPLVLDAVTA